MSTKVYRYHCTVSYSPDYVHIIVVICYVPWGLPLLFIRKFSYIRVDVWVNACLFIHPTVVNLKYINCALKSLKISVCSAHLTCFTPWWFTLKAGITASLSIHPTVSLGIYAVVDFTRVEISCSLVLVYSPDFSIFAFVRWNRLALTLLLFYPPDNFPLSRFTHAFISLHLNTCWQKSDRKLKHKSLSKVLKTINMPINHD